MCHARYHFGKAPLLLISRTLLLPNVLYFTLRPRLSIYYDFYFITLFDFRRHYFLAISLS
jgi:hypothetical protein